MSDGCVILEVNTFYTPMLRGILLAGISVIILNACQKTDPQQQQQDNGLITIGGIDSVRSEVLGESRTIWVHVPESAKDKTLTPVKYPVVYLLDGPEHFQSVVGMIKHLSGSNGNAFIPEMVVVAISNTDRARDLTPTHVDVDFFTGKKIRYGSGGNDKFLTFIETELIPYVDKKYPTTSYRTFVGHSFGGLSVINALITKPELFSNYVAIDPSLWWDNLAFADRADSILSAGKFDGKSLFVGIANTMPEGMMVGQLENDTLKTTAHMRSIMKFASSRESKSSGGLRFKSKYYEDDDHSSVPLITTYDAFRFAFDWYRLRGINQFFTPESKATVEDMLSLIDNHFKVVSGHFGYPQPPPESMMYSLGYGFLYNDMPDKAGALFDLNIKNFPTPQAYEARGDCYLAQQDSVNAMTLFAKCVDVGGTNSVQEKIDALKAHQK